MAPVVEIMKTVILLFEEVHKTHRFCVTFLAEELYIYVYIYI